MLERTRNVTRHNVIIGVHSGMCQEFLFHKGNLDMTEQYKKFELITEPTARVRPGINRWW